MDKQNTAVVKRSETGLKSPQKLDSLIEDFLSSQDVKEASKITYRKALRQFLTWLAASGESRPTLETVLRYKAELEREHTPATVSTYLIAVKKFFSWTEAKGFYLNIAAGVKGAKRSHGFRKDPLTVAQVRELQDGISRDTLEGKRNYALLNLMIRTGLRTIEIIRADVADIRQEGGEALLWIQGKGRDSKDEFVLLTGETLRPIMEYLSQRGKAEERDPLFASLSDRNDGARLTTRTIRGIVKKHLRGIGLDSRRLTAHSLRHTAVTLSLIAGASIQEAQAFARHSNINTTLIYSHNIDRVAHAPERKIDALLGEVVNAVN